MKDILLGIDIGTSGCRVAAFTGDGRVLYTADRPYATYRQAPGYAEQNPDDWWSSVCEATRETLSAGGIEPARVAGIGVAGQSWSAIPVDDTGRVLHRTPIWQDTRSADIASELTERVGFERIFSVSGNPLEPSYSTAKLVWFQRNRPDVYNRTRKFLQSNSFIAYRLTGRMTHDISQGYGVHAFDMRKGVWDGKLCEELGIDLERLPELVPCHEVIGTVTRKAAEETGLKEGTPVVAGGLDACCGTLGAGVYEPGQTQEQGGSAGGMSVCTGNALAHPKLILSFHVVPGRWLLQGGTTGGGGTLKWFKEQLGAAEQAQADMTGRSAFECLSDEADEVEPGSGGILYLPYMAGERSPLWDRHAKGVFFGLGYDKTRAQMARAVMEGCAYALEHNLRTAYEAGVEVAALNAMGGAANSLVWTQIKADVTGIPVRVPASDTATTMGAAMLAGVGTGLYKDFGQAVASTVRFTRSHEPNMKLHAKYREYYELYRELYERTKDLMERLDAIGSGVGK